MSSHVTYALRHTSYSHFILSRECYVTYGVCITHICCTSIRITNTVTCTCENVMSCTIIIFISREIPDLRSGPWLQGCVDMTGEPPWTLPI